MTATGTYGMRNELTTNGISMQSALGYEEDFQRKRTVFLFSILFLQISGFDIFFFKLTNISIKPF